MKLTIAERNRYIGGARSIREKVNAKIADAYKLFFRWTELFVARRHEDCPSCRVFLPYRFASG